MTFFATYSIMVQKNFKALNPKITEVNPMKYILTALATVVFLLSPMASFSGYVIHLKDGTKFVTDQYHEEGDQIKFKRYGGIIGIEKDRILEIVETDALTEPPAKKEPPAETPLAPANAETEKETAQGDKQDLGEIESPDGDQEETKKDELDDKWIDVVKYTKKKRALLEKRRVSLEKYRMARDVEDEAAKSAAKREYKKINNQLSELAAALRKENGGILPPWWSQIKIEKDESRAQP
jgi:hypothetical protein